MPSWRPPDLVLVGCVKTKRGARSAAKDLYSSTPLELPAGRIPSVWAFRGTSSARYMGCWTLTGALMPTNSR